MALINLTTNLKDLKFGKDRLGGGNSNEPFVAVEIPATEESLQTGFVSDLNVNTNGGSTNAIGASFLGGAVGGGIGFLAGGLGGAIIGGGLGAGVGSALGGGSSVTGALRAVPQAGTGGPDFLIRGNLLLPNALINDTIRLTKFFKDTKGVLFIVKQNILSLTAVRTQANPLNLLITSPNAGLYTPISTILGAVGSPFGLHVNKQGLNPLGSFLGLPTYSNNVKFDQPQEDNRLVNLFGAKLLAPKRDRPDPRFIKEGVSEDPDFVLSYVGGPNSLLGIGRTRLSLVSSTWRGFSDQFTNPLVNYLTYTPRLLNSQTKQVAINLGIGGGSGGTGTSNPNIAQPGNPNGAINVDLIAQEINQEEYVMGNSFKNSKYYIPALLQQDFRSDLISGLFSLKQNKTTLMSKAPSYDIKNNQTLELRTKLGDPGNQTLKNLLSYTIGYDATFDDIGEITGDLAKSFGAASYNSYDQINALPVYKKFTADQDSSRKPELYEDLVNFRIGVINNNNPSPDNEGMEYIHFRAFLDTITDNFTSVWNPTKYIGRGENFYTYGGFDRKVSLSWTVAAQSKVELIPMYKKLNFLASLCAPDYSDQGYMRGNIIKLTIGGYFYEQPGILTSLNYEMNSENDTWEINLTEQGTKGKEISQLPHILRVKGFEFIPIHEFAPKKQINSYDKSGKIESYGGQQYIALTSKDNKDLYNDTTVLSQDNILANYNGLPLPTPPAPPAPPPSSRPPGGVPRYG